VGACYRGHPLFTVESWTHGLKKLRPYYGNTTGPFPPELVDTAERIFAEFIPSQGHRVLLHGDLHHWNILAATREPWFALDPKGVIGEREYEVGVLLRNPDLGFLNREELKKLQARGIAILSEMLGFERKRMLGWGVAQAVLSAWWSVENHGQFGKQLCGLRNCCTNCGLISKILGLRLVRPVDVIPNFLVVDQICEKRMSD
jgi:streptomycin 6-kinase